MDFRRSDNAQANLLKGNLELILLSILQDKPKYGLEIIKEAGSRTGGYFDFKEGSLYPALHRLTEAGLLEAEFGYLPRGGAPVRFYHITEAGRRVLAHKREEFEEFSRAVKSLWSKG
ncbi:MAG: PadR family transcriptional regulator [Meiothermus sp.]